MSSVPFSVSAVVRSQENYYLLDWLLYQFSLLLVYSSTHFENSFSLLFLVSPLVKFRLIHYWLDLLNLEPLILSVSS